MQALPQHVSILDMPDYIESWAVAKVSGFVHAILERWLRAHPDLPSAFHLVMCPVAEINNLGGLPERVHLLTDPRLSCRHFTGCSRPYYAMIFTGPDSDTRRAEIQTLLPWSEGYAVIIKSDIIELHFVCASEELETDSSPDEGRNISALLESGELLKILA